MPPIRLFTKEGSMNNYQKNAQIIHKICTREDLDLYLINPDVRNDQDHIVNVVLTRIAVTFHDNPSFAFASYTSEDIYQFCWEWCIENLSAGKYNCKTSLYGYLEKVCKNKIKKLRRDKQWRTDISDQNACRKCKHRETCDRKVTYADLDTVPKCKVMKAAIERNLAKHNLSVQIDQDITESVCHKNHHADVEIAELVEFFNEEIPDVYKPVLHRLLHGNITGIPKKTIITARRWCWRILRNVDIEKAEQFQKIYYNSFQKESRQKERALIKQGVVRERRYRRKPVVVSDDEIKAVYQPGMKIGEICKVLGLANGGQNYPRIRRVLKIVK
jgi:hypothetical protein